MMRGLRLGTAAENYGRGDGAPLCLSPAALRRVPVRRRDVGDAPTQAGTKHRPGPQPLQKGQSFIAQPPPLLKNSTTCDNSAKV
jgi:hypothetical protein